MLEPNNERRTALECRNFKTTVEAPGIAPPPPLSPPPPSPAGASCLPRILSLLKRTTKATPSRHHRLDAQAYLQQLDQPSASCLPSMPPLHPTTEDQAEIGSKISESILGRQVVSAAAIQVLAAVVLPQQPLLSF
ncbi:hypothetical protein E2C01_049388 [Portunus trituberculatus]|uniref:Uncharacterized protein n=1 Tax=Portunus trituberculatus TaxID=210409 RepID=A0A5B7GDU3_PORTR|nr:hypothetical protein [Portunus trituberculatus]